VLETRRVRKHLISHGEQCAGRQHERRAGVRGDRLQARRRPRQPEWVGRICRHRDHAGVEAAEERGNVFEARWIEQYGALAAGTDLPQPHGDRPRLPIELGIGQMELGRFAVGEKREGAPTGIALRRAAEYLDEAARFSGVPASTTRTRRLAPRALAQDLSRIPPADDHRAAPISIF
jgi:hypothetical protein